MCRPILGSLLQYTPQHPGNPDDDRDVFHGHQAETFLRCTQFGCTALTGKRIGKLSGQLWTSGRLLLEDFA
jgi:hypothetical protein